MCVISSFKLYENVPESGSVTFEEIANQIGGNVGHVSIAIAQANPNLRLLVQDLLDQAEKGLTEAKENHPDLTYFGRLDFKPADFFALQPSWMAAESVDVCFMRYILHDWNDEYCIKIFKNLL